MEWLNIHISTLRSPEFIGSDPTERATWLCVLGYSVEQENGGRIAGGALWKDRQWQQACGVTLREVLKADRLLRADGDDLMVNGFPVAKQAQVKQARSVALAGAMARWGKNAARDAEKMPTGIETAMPVGNAEGKGREQEGKGREAHARDTPTPRSLIVKKLGRSGMCTTPEEIEKWLGFLNESCDAKTTEEACMVIGRLVEIAQGKAPINYVRQAQTHIEALLDAVQEYRDRKA